MKKLGEFDSFLFENHIIISLDKKWLEAFGELPKFEAVIDDKGKLHIKSTKSISYTNSTSYT